MIATGTATIVPGTVDTGNHCDECITTIPLPFPYTLYDQTYTQVGLDSDGRAVFGADSIWNKCLPVPGHTYTIYPYWDDLLTNQQPGCPPGGCGIFTSTSGVAPNRIFNIEWRTTYFDVPTDQANFELRLYEGQSRFDVIYGTVDQGNTGAIAGVQKDSPNFTQYFCWGSGGQASGSTTYTLAGTCPTPSHTSTPVPPSATPTTTPSPTAPTNTPVPATPSPTATSASTATPTACSVQFDDVPPEHAFYPFVRCLACRGIISGYADSTFRPDNHVTRGQLSKIVSNSAGFNEPVRGQTFEDVPPGSTFYEFVERLASREVMSGYTCGGPGEPCTPGNRPYFRPDAGATRGQLTKIVSNAAGFDDTIPPNQQQFADVPPNSTFWLYVERLLLNRPGIMSGYSCGGPGEPCDTGNRPYFRPGNPLTRGQTSKIVANTFFPGCRP
ncbi:MAG TPA: S-layer homology domain-containing protein [Chloroflexia bacterium]|nr:S-layer homology domain-containing protein [Chloroflexia bacterium]